MVLGKLLDCRQYPQNQRLALCIHSRRKTQSGHRAEGSESQPRSDPENGRLIRLAMPWQFPSEPYPKRTQSSRLVPEPPMPGARSIASGASPQTSEVVAGSVWHDISRCHRLPSVSRHACRCSRDRSCPVSPSIPARPRTLCDSPLQRQEPRWPQGRRNGALRLGYVVIVRQSAVHLNGKAQNSSGH